jgi:hypothetical protein
MSKFTGDSSSGWERVLLHAPIGIVPILFAPMKKFQGFIDKIFGPIGADHEF